jgi:hypothetical protein
MLSHAAGYQSTVTDYKGLLSLAKAQGIGNTTRGACKLCGCLGHLTRKCTNVLSGHTAATGVDEVPGAMPGAGGAKVLGLLPELGDISDLDSSDLSTSDSDDSSSSSSSDEDRKKRKRKHKESSKKHKKVSRGACREGPWARGCA